MLILGMFKMKYKILFGIVFIFLIHISQAIESCSKIHSGENNWTTVCKDSSRGKCIDKDGEPLCECTGTQIFDIVQNTCVEPCSKMHDGVNNWEAFCLKNSTRGNCIIKEGQPVCECTDNYIFDVIQNTCIATCSSSKSGKTWKDHCKGINLPNNGVPLTCRSRHEGAKCFCVGNKEYDEDLKLCKDVCISDHMSGGDWNKHCQNISNGLAICKNRNDGPQCHCLATRTDMQLNEKCKDYCESGTISFQKCSDEGKKCEKLETDPFYKCCPREKSLAGKECLDFCESGSQSLQECSSQGKICVKLVTAPFFKCENCLREKFLAGNECKDGVQQLLCSPALIYIIILFNVLFLK